MIEPVTSCDDCPYNGGVRGEEIICEFDHDPTDCPHKRRDERWRTRIPNPTPRT